MYEVGGTPPEKLASGKWAGHKGSIEFPGFGGTDPVKMDGNASRVK